MSFPSSYKGDAPYPQLRPNSPWSSCKLRVQTTLPAIVRAVTWPVPVITQTCLPSVTGDGEVLLCLRQSRLPSSSFTRQSSLPSVFERQRIYNSLPPGSFSASVNAGEGEVRKM